MPVVLVLCQRNTAELQHSSTYTQPCSMHMHTMLLISDMRVADFDTDEFNPRLRERGPLARRDESMSPCTC